MSAPTLTRKAALPASPCRVLLCPETHSVRRSLEAYIGGLYAHWFDARIGQYMPTLMGVLDRDGRLQGALGLRGGEAPSFFLEHYLDGSCEATLAAATGRPVARQDLVEVGNLAGSTAGGTRLLILALTSFLVGSGFEWTVFTATRSLRNSFLRLGGQIVDLGPATAARLPDGGLGWGRYYEMDPRVSAVNVAEMKRVLVDGELMKQHWLLWWNAAGTGRRHPHLHRREVVA